MGTNYVILVSIFLLLVVVDCSGNDSKGNVSEETGLDHNVDPVEEKVGSESISDTIRVSEVKDNGGDQIDVFEGDFDIDASKSNLTKQLGSNEGDNAHKGREESDVDAEGKTNDEKKENHDDSLDPKKVSKEEEIIQDSVRSPLPPLLTTNDDFRVKECNSSNMCMDMNKRFAACLRVPGNDSSDLLLLVRNKGKGPITLNISAPAFVQLEETDVELEENQDRKVKIFIKGTGIGNLIVLNDGTGDGECSLDFKDLITRNLEKSYYMNFFSQISSMVFLYAAAVILMLATRWMCKRFRWKQVVRSGSIYRGLDIELPVSSRTRREPDVNDEWDNGWGDNWGDEESPVTPSMPITPRLSSKGLASRRLSKDGWKD